MVQPEQSGAGIGLQHIEDGPVSGCAEMLHHRLPDFTPERMGENRGEAFENHFDHPFGEAVASERDDPGSAAFFPFEKSLLHELADRLVDRLDVHVELVGEQTGTRDPVAVNSFCDSPLQLFGDLRLFIFHHVSSPTFRPRGPSSGCPRSFSGERRAGIRPYTENSKNQIKTIWKEGKRGAKLLTRA